MGRSPYWDAAKFAFALAGGAGVAVTLLVGSWKAVKKASSFLDEVKPAPLAETEPEPTEKQ